MRYRFVIEGEVAEAPPNHLATLTKILEREVSYAMGTNFEVTAAEQVLSDHTFVVHVRAPNFELAQMALSARLGYDEDLTDDNGEYFDYQFQWADE